MVPIPFVLERSTMAARIRLITRGDDAGSALSANRAIRQCFDHGILRNASVMAVGPAVENAADLLGNLPGLCLGLHVALNCEWEHPRWGPVSPPQHVPTLLDAQGHFTHWPKNLAERQCSTDEMIAEVKAQLAKLRSLGLNIAYLDQHMGVGWVGGLNDALADLCAREGLINADKIFPHLPRATVPGPTPLDTLKHRLDSAPTGTYVLITHPSFADPEIHAYHLPTQPEGVIARERNEDRQLLTAPELRSYAAENAVEFLRFTDWV